MDKTLNWILKGLFVYDAHKEKGEAKIANGCGCLKEGEGVIQKNFLAYKEKIFGLNTEKYVPETIPCLDTFHAVFTLARYTTNIQNY